jgi:hypothetical protein
MLLDALNTYSSSPRSREDPKKFLIQSQFGCAMSIYHSFGLLKNHGIKSCFTFLKNFQEKEVKEKVIININLF